MIYRGILFVYFLNYIRDKANLIYPSYLSTNLGNILLIDIPTPTTNTTTNGYANRIEYSN